MYSLAAVISGHNHSSHVYVIVILLCNSSTGPVIHLVLLFLS